MKTTTIRRHFLPSAFRLSGFQAFLALLLAALLLPAPSATAAKSVKNVNVSRSGTNRLTNNARNQQNQNRDSDEGIIANIDENWSLELTPGYIKANGHLDKFYGATLALGYQLTQEDKFQLEIGCYKSSQYNDSLSYTRDFNYQRFAPFEPDILLPARATMSLRGDISAKATNVPVMFSYSYSMRLDPRERLELRVTPAIGFIAMFTNWSLKNATGTYSDLSGAYVLTDPVSPVPAANGSYVMEGDVTVRARESFNGTQTKLAFAIGAGAGLTWHFTDRCYLDVGYRFTWTDKVSANLHPATGTPWNGILAWSGMDTHTYTLTLGWKF